MKPTPRKIKQELKKLRAFIESRDDSVRGEVEGRIAYAVEQAIRWTTENTDWESPREQVISSATCLLRVDLGPLVAKTVSKFVADLFCEGSQ